MKEKVFVLLRIAGHSALFVSAGWLFITMLAILFYGGVTYSEPRLWILLPEVALTAYGLAFSAYMWYRGVRDERG